MRVMSTNHSTQNRNRVPEGVPAGGQFVTERRGEAGLSTLSAPAPEDDEGGRLDLVGTVDQRWEMFSDGDRNVTAQFRPEEWGDDDNAYPIDSRVEDVHATAIFDRMDLDQVEAVGSYGADTDHLYEAALEAGYVSSHDGPYSFTVDEAALEEYIVGRQRYGLEAGRPGPVPVNPSLPSATPHGGVTAPMTSSDALHEDAARYRAVHARLAQMNMRENTITLTEAHPEAVSFVLDDDGGGDSYHSISRAYDADGREIDLTFLDESPIPGDELDAVDHLGQLGLVRYDGGTTTFEPIEEDARVPFEERPLLTRMYSVEKVRSAPLPQNPQQATPYDPMSHHLSNEVGGPIRSWQPNWDASGTRFDRTVTVTTATGETRQVSVEGSAQASQMLGWHEQRALEVGDGGRA